MPNLILGPMLRYVDARTATVWVQTDAPCTVEILGVSVRTFQVCGLHFALVSIDGLESGLDHPYEVRLDGEPVWPPAGSAFPPSSIRLLGDAPRLRLIFGSCRITRPHEPPHTLRGHQHPHGQGIDALRAYAFTVAHAGGGWALPDLLLMLGDQIYADQPSPQLRAELAQRARPGDAPDDELSDFGEYAMSYQEAWSEPAVRWLLSTVPTAMVFDDHEIHAEWRISEGWLEEMYSEPWFERHIRCGLMAYWVFQHAGNLSPATLAEDGMLAELAACEDGRELLASRMAGAGRQRGHSHWSYSRELGNACLVVIDSRAGREVTPGRRELIQSDEWVWVREQAARPSRHLLLASSVPFLLAPAQHFGQAWDEALTDGVWGSFAARLGEWIRRRTVMDHWASFQRSFRAFATLVEDVSHGRAGEAPASVVLLSGDVHHCYLAQASFSGAQPHSAVWQAVCSGFRKELAPHERAVIALGHSDLAGRVLERLARSARVAPLQMHWRVTEGPAYANQIATLTLDGEAAHVRVDAVVDGEWREPRLEVAFARWLTPEPPAEADPLPTVAARRVPRRSAGAWVAGTARRTRARLATRSAHHEAR
jgi:hypothetical protein